LFIGLLQNSCGIFVVISCAGASFYSTVSTTRKQKITAGKRGRLWQNKSRGSMVWGGCISGTNPARSIRQTQRFRVFSIWSIEQAVSEPVND
jgi:hypothetical protein